VLSGLLLAAAICAGERTEPAAGVGKQGYEPACVRCHGDDGNLDTHPNVRKLGGIGKRLTSEEIRGRLHPLPLGKDLYSVRSHLFSERQLQALIAYLKTL
jgi:hypothetical protein